MMDVRRKSFCAALVLLVGLGTVGLCHAEAREAPLQEAEQLNKRVHELAQAGQYDQAIPVAERALSLFEAALPPTDRKVGGALNVLAGIHYFRGDFAKAEPLYVRALAIREAALGPRDPAVASTLNNLAVLHHDQGRFARARPLYLRSLEIREAVLGPKHPDVADSLLNLARLYKEQGTEAEARPLLLRAIKIWEAALGPDHPRVAIALMNLAILYGHDYARAEPLLLRSLKIREAALGPKHPDVAESLLNLAMLYHYQGAFSRAEPLLLRAIKIQEAVLGPNHPDVAAPLHNLAGLYSDQGRHAKAEPLMLRAVKIQEVALGADHPDVAFFLVNLAVIYRQMGAYGKAEPLLLRALTIQEAALGRSHPDLAFTLRSLAELYREMGAYGKAEPLFARALKNQEVARGPSNPEVAATLKGLAMLHLAQGRSGPARLALGRAFAISEQHLRKDFSALSETRLAAFLQILRVQEDAIYSLLLRQPADPEVRRLALTVALLRKGRSVEELAGSSRAASRDLSPSDREQLERVRRLRSQFASLSLAGPGKLPPQEYQAHLKQLEEEADALEEDLARRSHRLRAQQQGLGPETVIQQVAAALPRNGALLEIVQVPPFDLRRGEAAGTGDPQYLAMVLSPDGRIGVADLGPAGPLDGAVARLRAVLADPARAYQREAMELSRLVLDPLLPLLGGRRNLFLSLDGQLQMVPFAVLFDHQRLLAEDYQLTYLTSARDLLRRDEGAAARAQVVVLADPAFDAAPAARAAPLATAGAPPSPVAAPGTSRPDRGLLQARYQPLPGTRREAELIRSLWPSAQLLLGSAATEPALLGLRSPGILHVATHGSFLADPEPAPQGGRSLLLEQAPPPPNPLLRSALVLAGAGRTAAHKGGLPDGEEELPDGLATALEVAGMDLSGTQLVVLSACQTGQGEVRAGQGVYGLRRAVMVAGAQTLVTSLWRIGDQVTSELIGAYYRNLRAGQGRVEALQRASTSVRARWPHPYHWAPFIVIGRGDALRGLGRPSAQSAPPP